MQPSSNNLSDSDLELLSAYIDNALSVAERVNLERRLAADPRLRAELEQLQATTRLLRQLPPVPPPRSFTLDPAPAPRPAPVFRLSWFMQLGSGLAGLALVLLATVQLLASAPWAVGMAPAAAPAPVVLEVSPTGTTTSSTDESNVPAATPAPAAGIASTPFEAPPQPHATAPASSDTSAAPASADSARQSAPEAPATAGAAQAPPAEVKPPPAPRPGFPAGLTLTLGLALIALALAWRFIAR
ncbi:MAG: hypothetical protein N2378_10585 [Chloroflexaceae bacterium]|nr:hypothetical protein [Chloroflexaceae bacterium]